MRLCQLRWHAVTVRRVLTRRLGSNRCFRRALEESGRLFAFANTRQNVNASSKQREDDRHGGWPPTHKVGGIVVEDVPGVLDIGRHDGADVRI